MSGDISVRSHSYQIDNREWLIGQHGVDATPGVTLDISKFTKADHYPNGVIPSGTRLGIVTATQLYGPYDDTATDGRQVCRGLLFSFAKAVDEFGTVRSKVSGARFVHGVVKESKLPGTIDAAGKADLPLIIWV